jgi:CBS domain-containing protein
MGEIVGLISGRDVKTWRKTGEWYVPMVLFKVIRLTDRPAGFDEPAAPQPEVQETMEESDEERILEVDEEDREKTEDR